MAILSRLGKVLKTDLTRDLRHKNRAVEDNNQDILHFMKQRRTIKDLGKKVLYEHEYLTEVIKESVHCCPSALNSQSARVIILTDKAHYKFWQMVKKVQAKNLPEHIVESANMKIDQCINAYGTVLFFEDLDVVRQLQRLKPLQAAEFSIWSEQTSGMVQFAVWTALSSLGLGASLHHYNPAIDHETTAMFDLPASWHMKAQLVFGSIQKAAQEKKLEDDAKLFRIYDDI